jgi:hypothetical protein
MPGPGETSRTIEVGDRFGRWVVVDIPLEGVWDRDRYANGELHHVRWVCVCDCGTRRSVTGGNLLSGGSRSCGCLTVETTAARFRTHGQAGSRLHMVWGNMLQRCTNPASHGWSSYGRRGIGVCEAWRDFATFATWALESGYREGLSIERIDNDGPYSPDNCTWETRRRQARNTRTNRFIEAWGEVKTLADWAEDRRCVVGYYTLFSRLMKLGWPAEKAITTPPQIQRRAG